MDVGSGKVLEVGVAGLRRQMEWRRVDLAGVARENATKRSQLPKIMWLGGSETTRKTFLISSCKFGLEQESWQRRLGQIGAH
jgi:hypothetical protein